VNLFDDLEIDRRSFAFRDLLDQDLWDEFTVSGSITVVGTPTYSGRYHIMGKVCQFQISAVATTSIATAAGTSYFALPIAAKGIGGMATMQNLTTNVAVGVCVIDITNSRAYLPTQAASANTFAVCGSYEI